MKKTKLTKVIVSSLILASVLALKPVYANAEWRQDNTGWWYAEDNSWASGWKLIDGNWYYFNSNGYMAQSTTIDGYKINSDGKWIQEIVLATVGNEKITKDDLDEEIKRNDEELKQNYGNDYATNENVKDKITEIKKQQLDNMIIEKILLKKASELNLRPSDADLNAQINEYKAYYYEDGQFEIMLQKSNSTEDEFNESVKKSIIAETVKADIVKDVTVQDNEIQTYYDENKDSEFVMGPGGNVAHILVADEEAAKKLKAQLDAGADFATLAKENSIDPGTKDAGGNLGFIPYNSTDFIPEFMDKYKTLKEGEISEPVKSEYGYHLIKVTGIRDSKVLSFDYVKDIIKSKLLNTKKESVLNAKIEQWKTELKVKTYENDL